MDCIALNPTSDEYGGFQLNCSGWTYMGHLISQCVSNASQVTKDWAGTNDGQEVSEKDARAMGEALLKALKEGRIKEMRVKDKRYTGGYFSVAFVEGSAIPFLQYDFEETEGSPYAAKVTPIFPVPNDLRPLQEGTKKWIESFAMFLLNCGGFAQW
jgi:hypothetical protein